MKPLPPPIEIPVVWTAVLLAWFKAIPWAELAACAAFIYTVLRLIGMAVDWLRRRNVRD